MGDEGATDPCECIWGHEMAMRRLLNVIRNSQSVCTDNECYESGYQSPNSYGDMLMITLFVAGLFLYFFRPRTQQISGPDKSNANDRNGNPPSPPSPMF